MRYLEVGVSGTSHNIYLRVTVKFLLMKITGDIGGRFC